MSKQANHQIDPDKLLLSKWTAVQTSNKEKHFLFTRLIGMNGETVVDSILEAIINHREVELD
jgi:tryptophan-rich hypothetical protein